VQGTARRVHGSILLALVARGAGSGSRVGITVSRKVGGAVVRNRVKRWLRESVRAVGAPAGGPWDLVLVARAGAATAGYAAVEAQVRDLFHREVPARVGRGGAVP
jgi:ribonuclease P protein component